MVKLSKQIENFKLLINKTFNVYVLMHLLLSLLKVLNTNYNM
jgi:hypothetical protein